MYRNFSFLLIGLLAGLTSAQGQVAERVERVGPVVRAFAFNQSSYLGVETAEVSKENMAKLGLREVRGIAIEKVTPNSPAHAAGLQVGDVIVKFGDDTVTSVRKFSRLVGEVAPDHRVKVTVLRGGSEREFDVTIAKREMPKIEGFDAPQFHTMEHPPMPPGSVPPMFESPRKMPDGFSWVASRRVIGVGVTPLTKQLAAHFGVENGALVNNVEDGFPAAKAGLKAGDIILEVDGKAVKSDFDLIREVGSKKEGSVNITFFRNRERQTVTVEPIEGKAMGLRVVATPVAPENR